MTGYIVKTQVSRIITVDSVKQGYFSKDGIKCPNCGDDLNQDSCGFPDYFDKHELSNVCQEQFIEQPDLCLGLVVKIAKEFRNKQFRKDNATYIKGLQKLQSFLDDTTIEEDINIG